MFLTQCFNRTNRHNTENIVAIGSNVLFNIIIKFILYKGDYTTFKHDIYSIIFFFPIFEPSYNFYLHWDFAILIYVIIYAPNVTRIVFNFDENYKEFIKKDYSLILRKL